MDLQHLLSLPIFGSHLDFSDLRSLILVSKGISTLILGDRGSFFWENLCFREFGYRIRTETSFKQKYLGFRHWLLHKKPLEEPFEQLNDDPKQSISLFDEFGIGIRLHGKPFHVHPFNWSGSLVRCYTPEASPSITKEVAESVESVAAILNTGHLDAYQPLTTQFASFLALLHKGSYTIEAIPSDRQQCRLLLTSNGTDSDHFQRIIAFTTQDDSIINPERVEYYKDLILSGKEPFVLAAVPRPMTSERFIIDGHHKALAYQELNRDPAWILVLLNSPDESPLETMGYEIEQSSAWALWCNDVNIKLPVDGQFSLSEEELSMVSDKAALLKNFQTFVNAIKPSN